MADSTTGKRKRSKGFYVGVKKKKNGQEVLTPGMKGVLVTCNEREKLCIKEAYNVLNEYADQLYGPEHNSEGDNNAIDDNSSDEIEESLAKEVKQLQAPCQERRFQAVLSGTNNVIFIKTNLPDSKDPADLVHTALTDIMMTRCKKTRYCQRFLPISDSCHANSEDMRKLATKLFQRKFLAEDAKPSKFCVIYRCRNNSTIQRDDTITMLASIVENAGKGHTVDLTNPDLAICVEIIKNVCCMSVVRDLFKLRKYNIHEVNKQILNGSIMTDDRKTEVDTNIKTISSTSNQDLATCKTDASEKDSDGAMKDQTSLESKESSCSGILKETVGVVDPSLQDNKDAGDKKCHGP